MTKRIEFIKQHSVETDPEKNTHSAYKMTFGIGAKRAVLDIAPNGWARINEPGFGEMFIPPAVFKIEETKERTYTESEVKAMRDAWEKRWSELQDQSDSWKSIAKEEGAIRLKRERELGDLEEKMGEAIADLVYEHDLTKGYMQETIDAQKRKLDLLAPEIERIEKAVERVVLPDDDGFSLAEQVEGMAAEIQLWRRDYGKGRDYITAHSFAGRLDVLSESLNAARDRIEENTRVMIQNLKSRGIVFTETEHPEDVYIRQQQESKPRRPVRNIR